MTISITHAFVSGKTDGADATKVQPSNWNAGHPIKGYYPDTSPGDFPPVIDAPLNTLIEVDDADVITLTTADDSGASDDRVFAGCVRSDDAGGTPQVKVNSLAWSDHPNLRTGDTFKLRAYSPSSPLSERNITFYLDGRAYNWNITTADVDPDAAAVVAATGITDPDEVNAVTDLITGMKTASIWSKFKALYGFIGGTAAAHKINWIDTDDDDASFRLTFHGTWTHDANGIQGDGATAYAQTHYTQSSTTNESIGAYSRSSAAHGGGGNPLLDDYAIAASDAGWSNMTTCSPRTQGDKVCFFYGTNTYSPGATNTDGSGLFVTNRNGGTATECYHNGSLIHTQNDTVTLCSQEYYIGALNKGGSPNNYTDRPLALVFIAEGMDSTENAAFSTLVQAYQTALERQV